MFSHENTYLFVITPDGEVTVDSKWYGLLQVMGYHSMGYLRFDCRGQTIPDTIIREKCVASLI